MWDRNFAYGQGFHEQIETHRPCPRIPASADKDRRCSEMGAPGDRYSMALHIPALIAVEELPVR